jgi:hypothetical protein
MNSAELPSDLSVHVAPLRIGSTSEDDKQRLASGSFPIVLYKQKCVPHAIVEVFVVLYFVARAGIATRLRDGRPGFDSPQEQGLFLFVTAFRQALGHTQPPIQCLPGVKWPGRESDHLSPASAEVKNAWICTSTPPYVFMARYFVKPGTTSLTGLLRRVAWWLDINVSEDRAAPSSGLKYVVIGKWT